MNHSTSMPVEDALRKTDVFTLCISPLEDGHRFLEIRLGSAPRVRMTLTEKHDELMKLRSWIEEIARGVSPAIVSFADGTALSCRREYDDETGFAKTERFLDEEYPTSISTFCVRDAQGTEHRALIKTKHFLNLLYMEALLDRKPSHLVEWYLSCREALPKRFPHFKSIPIRKGTLKMWADFADAVFWQGTNIGDYNYLHIDDTYIDLSDVSSLETWYDDFYLLTSEDDMHTKPPFAIIGEEARQEWHVRGLKIAEILRSRIPQHYVFVYMQSWPLADLTPYFANDCGRIIFDERFIEGEEE
ncbi:MAG: hypothetical protein MJ051_06170 [Akkermansia sp.]|nr:hypothetical protein [Akkermansia sp.]